MRHPIQRRALLSAGLCGAGSLLFPHTGLCNQFEWRKRPSSLQWTSPELTQGDEQLNILALEAIDGSNSMTSPFGDHSFYDFQVHGVAGALREKCFQDALVQPPDRRAAFGVMIFGEWMEPLVPIRVIRSAADLEEMAVLLERTPNPLGQPPHPTGVVEAMHTLCNIRAHPAFTNIRCIVDFSANESDNVVPDHKRVAAMIAARDLLTLAGIELAAILLPQSDMVRTPGHAAAMPLEVVEAEYRDYIINTGILKVVREQDEALGAYIALTVAKFCALIAHTPSACSTA